MFELAVARKYLIPRVRQLSVSIISLISVFVIATVVWLSIVFFSAQEGIERSWTEKMVALTAPIRLTPTTAYYKSYYYLVDAYATKSNFAFKTLREKLASDTSNPYDPLEDPSLPADFPSASTADIVNVTKKTIDSLPGVSSSIFETATGTLSLRLFRDFGPLNSPSEQEISASAYLMSFDSDNRRLHASLLPVTAQDVQHMLEELEGRKEPLAEFFKQVSITEVCTPSDGWKMPAHFIQEGAKFDAVGSFSGTKLLYISFTDSEDASFQHARGTLYKKDGRLIFRTKTNTFEADNTPLYLEGGAKFAASIRTAPQFMLTGTLQQQVIEGQTSLNGLQVQTFQLHPTDTPLWLAKSDGKWFLPNDGIVLPKSFQEAGVLLGDQGYIHYHGFGATAVQEQRLKVFVAGFYDPGILPIGGKVILVSPTAVSQILSASFSEERSLPTGFNVDFQNLKEAKAIKEELLKKLKAQNLASNWNVQTYEEYDFSKDIFQQMKSDKNLFALISVIITIVACSNIISMLIILVHDKRKEIAILRALGASKKSIAFIFGLCGFLLGAIGSVIGALLAIFTLHNLQTILTFLGKLQGFEVLSSTFYANSLPNEVSIPALVFVICMAAIASCLAGMIPAIQASRINTSEALRNE